MKKAQRNEIFRDSAGQCACCEDTVDPLDDWHVFLEPKDAKSKPAGVWPTHGILCSPCNKHRKAKGFAELHQRRNEEIQVACSTLLRYHMFLGLKEHETNQLFDNAQKADDATP
jgi:hypothetical protein